MTDDEALAELRSKCSDLRQGIERATSLLEQALVRGECTFNLRGRLNELMSDLDAAQAQFRMETEKLIDDREVRIASEANDYVKGVARKLKRMLATLAPPPSPSMSVN